LNTNHGALSHAAILRAETLMRQAVAWDGENRSAHRGLGWALVEQHEEAEAGVEWLAGGFSSRAFIRVGVQMQNVGQYEESVEWYARAARIEPDSGDPWYYMGLAYGSRKEWEKSLEAYRWATKLGNFSGVGSSSPYYRMGVIYQWRLQPPQAEKALAVYEAAIELDDFSAVWEAADCHYKRGEILAWTDSDPDEYIAEYQRAIELDPDHVHAHILLGVACYAHYKDLAMAEAEIQRALELSPQNKRAYVHLGDIYRQEGRTNEAAKMYGRALDIDPEFELAHQQLLSLQQDVE